MLPDPAIDPDEVLLKTYDALQRVMTGRGVDLRYGRLLIGRFRAYGLVDVAAEGRLFMVQGGSPGATLYTANFEQVRDAMVQSGLVTNEQVDADLRHLEEQRLIGPSPIMWAVRGRRP
jgi:hypothetical protein